MTNDDVLLKLAEVEQRATSNTRRIDKMEHQTEALNSLATSVAVMAEQLKTINVNVDTLTSKVDVLEATPGKRWNSVVEKAILTIVAAVIGFILAKLGL